MTVARMSKSRALTTDELLRILKVASGNKRNHAMILLAFRHGMRSSEVCNLKMADIDLTHGQITIRRLKGSRKTIQPLNDIPGQPLVSELRILKAWLKERAEWTDHHAWVFPSQRGGPLSRFGFWYVFQTVCRKAKIPANKAHPHVLKHSLGFALADQNVSAEIIRQVLGHASIWSTTMYTRPTDETASRAADAALAVVFRS